MDSSIRHAATLEEMKERAVEWAGKVSASHVLLLTGEVGAGKTQFCQFVLNHFGVRDVSSPTFNLIHSYPLPQKTIHHLDLYRLESEDELESIGLWDLFLSPALLLIEWGEKVDLHGLEQEGWTLERLNISVGEGGVRRLELERL